MDDGLKDLMAVDRTCWAAERTWLAHLRTALAIFIGSFTAHHLEMISVWSMIMIAGFSVFWGVTTTVVYVRRLKSLRN